MIMNIVKHYQSFMIFFNENYIVNNRIKYTKGKTNIKRKRMLSRSYIPFVNIFIYGFVRRSKKRK